jgi:hypothetical protein
MFFFSVLPSLFSQFLSFLSQDSNQKKHRDTLIKYIHYPGGVEFFAFH